MSKIKFYCAPSFFSFLNEKENDTNYSLKLALYNENKNFCTFDEIKDKIKCKDYYEELLKRLFDFQRGTVFIDRLWIVVPTFSVNGVWKNEKLTYNNYLKNDIIDRFNNQKDCLHYRFLAITVISKEISVPDCLFNLKKKLQIDIDNVYKNSSLELTNSSCYKNSCLTLTLKHFTQQTGKKVSTLIVFFKEEYPAYLEEEIIGLEQEIIKLQINSDFSVSTFIEFDSSDELNKLDPKNDILDNIDRSKNYAIFKYYIPEEDDNLTDVIHLSQIN